MGLQVLRQPVIAKTRKLQAKWTIEAMQDLSAQHGLDLEAEITQALSAAVFYKNSLEEYKITEFLYQNSQDMAKVVQGRAEKVVDFLKLYLQ